MQFAEQTQEIGCSRCDSIASLRCVDLQELDRCSLQLLLTPRSFLFLRRSQRIQEKNPAFLASRLQPFSDESDALFSLLSEGVFPPDLDAVQRSSPLQSRCFQTKNAAAVCPFGC